VNGAAPSATLHKGPPQDPAHNHAPRPSLWRQLHVRAGAVALLLLLLLGGTVFFVARNYTERSAMEVMQRSNLGLAQYVVEHQSAALIKPDGQPDQERVQDLAMHVMAINPAVEVYVLNSQGVVLAHALRDVPGPNPVGTRVDLAPIQKLLSTPPSTLRLPLLGDDPRQGVQVNNLAVGAAAAAFAAISVAPLAAPPSIGPGVATPAQSGYLYIVLNSQNLQTVAASLANSDALRALLAALSLATLAAAVVLYWALQKLTRPLRELTAELGAFRHETDDAQARPPQSEISVLRMAATAMQARIAQQFARLEESDQLRRELVSNISHDLRTPLSSIRGYVETVLLRGEGLDANTRGTHLKTALRHVNVLDKRIADLFELSKLDAGRVQPTVEVFCLAELLQDVVQNYQLTAQQRGVRLGLSVGSQRQARVSADIALIERVLQNLVDNALRYTAQDGEVTLGLTAQGSQLQVSVSDTGRGIAQEHLPHIFERYWRASDVEAPEHTESHATQSTSSGLGLAIVKRIVELHGSVVQVHSELRQGTRIEFALPRVA
jgi:two-component system, OmpR family, sensor kinase